MKHLKGLCNVFMINVKNVAIQRGSWEGPENKLVLYFWGFLLFFKSKLTVMIQMFPLPFHKLLSYNFGKMLLHSS